MHITIRSFLWNLTKKFKFQLFGLLLIALWWAVHTSLTPLALKYFIDSLSETSTSKHWNAVWIAAFFYVFLVFFLGVVFRIYDWLQLKTFPQMRSRIIENAFAYVEQHSYSYYQKSFAGSLANKINDLAKSAVVIIDQFIEYFIARSLSLLIGAITMFFVHPYFFIVVLVWSLLFISVSLLFSKKTKDYSKIYSEAKSTVVGRIVDNFSNVLNIKLFAREKYEVHHLKKNLTEMVAKDQTLRSYLLKVKCFYSSFVTLLIVVIVFLLIYERSQNAITIGDFALILTLTMSLIEEVTTLANHLVTFSEDLGTCQQALSIISVKQELLDEPMATPLVLNKGEIVFDRVSFSYKKEANLFSNKSVTIHPGEKVGLVGFSGSGKSTFVNLILRFFDIDKGRILIDGQDIKKVTQSSLRSQIAMIPQEPILFHRSLMENIRYGRVDATDEEVIACAKEAHCHEFIIKLKDGYDSLVGERGVKLSGGQRQRIAIARAMLKNAPILILDEATSAMDSITENYIQESLATLMQHKTTIVIAHRLSTLFRMNRLLVFSAGKIVEEGSHDDLIKQNGPYAKLWEMQAGGFFMDSQVHLT